MRNLIAAQLQSSGIFMNEGLPMERRAKRGRDLIGLEWRDKLVAALWAAAEGVREPVAMSIRTARVRGSVYRCGCDTRIERGVEIRNPRQVELGDRAYLRRGCVLNGRSDACGVGIRFGPDTYLKEHVYADAYGGFIETAGPCAVSQFCHLHGNGGLCIGKYVIVGGGAMLLAGNHRTSMSDRPFVLQGSNAAGIKVEDNVWIGAGAIVLDGVTIGANSVIGASAVVTDDIPSGVIAIGAPARVLRDLA